MAVPKVVKTSRTGLPFWTPDKYIQDTFIGHWLSHGGASITLHIHTLTR